MRIAAPWPSRSALTTTSVPGATDDDKQLLENLLALMEVEASRHANLEVVERLQLDLRSTNWC